MAFAPRYPAPLAIGSKIFVTAPSSGVAAPHWARLEVVTRHLRELGYSTEEGRCLRQQGDGASAPARERAEELMAALLRPDVAAVFPPWGGELAIELLDLIDWSRLAREPPKWLMGFSDISTLMLPLLLRCGWASAHGLNLLDLAPGLSDELSRGALTGLGLPPGSRFRQRSSAHWQKQFADFSVDSHATFRLTEPTRYWLLSGESRLHARGRVLGGCLDTWMHLVGTPYGDVRAFIESTSSDGCLLFLENAGLEPPTVARALRQMLYAGWFDGISALFLGRSAAAPNASASLSYEQAVQQSLASVRCPVLMDVDFGHRPPQFSVIQGSLGELWFDAEQGARFEQTLA